LIPLQALHAAIGHPAYSDAHIVGNFPKLALQNCTLQDTRHSGNLVVVWGELGSFRSACKTTRKLVSISSAGLKK
jgi:hypothetical protein